MNGCVYVPNTILNVGSNFNQTCTHVTGRKNGVKTSVGLGVDTQK